MLPPSASRMVRVWPTEPQSAGWSATSRIAGKAAYRREKTSGSLAAINLSKAWAGSTATSRDASTR